MNIFQQIAQTDRKRFQSARRKFQQECRTFTDEYRQIRRGDAGDIQTTGQPAGSVFRAPEAMFRNRSFFVMLFMDDCEGTPFLRMTVIRTELDNNGGWKGDITWDELMSVKRGVGFADLWMTEVFPPDEEIVNGSNMRHLFLVNQPPFAWSKKAAEAKPARQESVLGKILSRFRKP